MSRWPAGPVYGNRPQPSEVDCPDCDGRGYHPVQRWYATTCDTCGGKGYLEPPENPADRGDE